MVFDDHFHRDYSNRRNAIEVSVICSRGKSFLEEDDMAVCVARKAIDTERSKWAAMLPKQTARLRPWLLEQSADIKANPFAFCMAATLDSVSDG